MGSKLTDLTRITSVDTGDLIYVARTVGDTGVSSAISRKDLDDDWRVLLSRAQDTGKYLADTGAGGLSFVIDEDNMASDSATKVPTQQSVKAYVDAGPSTAALQATMRDRIDTAPYVATRTALKALDTTKDTVAILTEAGREGVFVWRAGNYATQVTADANEALYLKADAIATTAGAWQRLEADDGPLQARWAGSLGDDSTNDTAALIAGFNTAKALSLSMTIGAGVYRVQNASGAAFVLDMDDLTAAATSERKRPDVRGAGQGVTVINGRTASQFAMQLLGGTGISSHHSLTIGDMSFGGVAAARGLHIFNSAYIKVENCQFTSLGYGLSLESCLSSEFNHLHFYGCTVGTELKTGAGFSGANALVFNKCVWGLSAANGVAGLSLSTNVVFNDCNFEGNGEHANSFAGGCVLTFTGAQGTVGATFKNCWFEANKGGFDVQLVNGATRMTHVFIGCNFTRSVAAAYVTNHIQSFGANRIVLIGCTFDSYNGYTPDASRLVVGGDGLAEVVCIGCVWMNPVEQGKLYNIGQELFSFQAASRAGSDVSTAQAVFDAAQDTFTLLANVTYEFEADYRISRAAGTTSHTTGVLFGGTATYTIDYLADVSNPTGNVLGAVSAIEGNAATEVVLTAANTSATENLRIKLKGVIRVTAAGTLIPQFKYSAAPGGAPTIKRNTSFKLRAIGTDLAATAGAVA